MHALHIRTTGMFCDACPPRIESELEHLPGVKAARAFRTMSLTSVLFDPDLVDAVAIRDRIASAGFGAQFLDARGSHQRRDLSSHDHHRPRSGQEQETDMTATDGAMDGVPSGLGTECRRR